MRLFKSVAIVLSTTLIVPQIASAQAPPRFSLPLGGHTFLSQTADGVGVIGALNIEGFENQGGEVIATGIVQADLTNTGVNPSSLSPELEASLTPDGTELMLPVKIVSATCSKFDMEIGPVPGLTSPIVVSVGKGKATPGEVTTDQLPTACELAKAVKNNQADSLVALLNASEGTGGGNLKSCGFLEVIKCAFAATTCGGACILGPVACVACLASIGYLGCQDCI